MLAKALVILNELFSLPLDSWSVPRAFYTVYQTNDPNLFLKVFDEGIESPVFMGREELQSFLESLDNEDETEELSLEEVKALIDNDFDMTAIITDLMVYAGIATYGEEE